MRVLDFKVYRQTIECDPNCDFTGIAPGTRGYLSARFRFSTEWRGCKRVAIFTCRGKEYPTPIINGACVIPFEALLGNTVEVAVIGQCDSYRITTNKTSFKQEGHVYGNG